MKPTPISKTRVIAVQSFRLSAWKSSGTMMQGLNERMADELQKCAADGFTELVDVRYAIACDAEVGDFDTTFSALLVVRKPD